ncbi:MurR/RpiR family transcriptional regulator [Pararhizobium haloflavum]|uniref:MurR/RpiR family transcriptional regulator n=1 Tax=Pararhizobium haloflavum TaxID=2037914 RepID=UPI0018E46F31|nr:MurR/RpiR family transcriptional regulator [Pararhizobium haloflavum]
MNVLETLRKTLPDLSAREARAARHLMANYPMAGLTTVAEFAGKSNVSTATVLRLVRRLGFPLYAEFQEALRAHIEETLQSPLLRLGERKEKGEPSGTSFLSRTIMRIKDHLDSLADHISDEEFNSAVALLADPKRDIHLIGGRYSTNVARYTGDLLTAVRGKVETISGQTETWPQHLLDMGRSSVLVVFDVRRYQSDVVAFTEAAARRGATIILLTDVWQSPAARVSKVVLPFAVDSPSIFDMLTLGMGLAEALVGAVAERADEAGMKRIEQLETLRSDLASGFNGTGRSKHRSKKGAT